MTPIKTLPFAEFVFLIAIMFSLVAFSTDAMLPGLPDIAEGLGVHNVNRVQLVITIFVLGSGLGQLFFGPLSDAVGRKPTIVAGTIVMIIGCAMCYFAQNLTWMLLGRFVQGLGAAAPRTGTMAMVRDLYQGRAMARVMSYAMGIFILVPAVAPSLGQLIMNLFGWRAIFISFVVFSIIAVSWMSIRQPESHPPEKRRVLRGHELFSGLKEVSTNPIVMLHMLVLGLVFGCLFAYLSSVQQIFVDTLGVGDRFPLYFAAIAFGSGSAAFINGALVMRVGMRPMCKFALFMVTLISMLSLLFQIWGPQSLQLHNFTLWSVAIFLFISLSFGNLNALAMEPMGHIAGLAAAVIGMLSTVLAVLLAIPIGLAFNGTPLPLIISVMLLNLLGFGLLQIPLQSGSQASG